MVTEEQLHALVQEFHAEITPQLPPGVGYAFILFGGGKVSYISNAERADVIPKLRKMAKHLEREK
jgi:hypothetical protein